MFSFSSSTCLPLIAKVLRTRMTHYVRGFGISELFARVVVSFVKCLVSLSELKVGKEQRCLALFLQLQASVFGRPKRWFRLHSMWKLNVSGVKDSGLALQCVTRYCKILWELYQGSLALLASSNALLEVSTCLAMHLLIHWCALYQGPRHPSAARRTVGQSALPRRAAAAAAMVLGLSGDVTGMTTQEIDMKIKRETTKWIDSFHVTTIELQYHWS